MIRFKIICLLLSCMSVGVISRRANCTGGGAESGNPVRASYTVFKSACAMAVDDEGCVDSLIGIIT